MQEYMNLIKVTFDFSTIDTLEEATKQEIILMLDDLQHQACLYPVPVDKGVDKVVDKIPELILNIALENRKLKLSFCLPQDILCNNPQDFIISFSPYVGAVREYRDICNSYKDALVHDNSASIETIDMARRGLHNQAADLMQARFKHKIHGNHQAFRLLFSLMNLVF